MIIGPQTAEEATARFWTFLVMGNGALGLGVAQLPRLSRKIMDVQRLGGRSSAAGPRLPVPGPLLLYPEAPRVADLEAVIRDPKLNDISKLVDRGPKDTYLAQCGCVAAGLAFPHGCLALETEADGGGEGPS